MNQTTDGVKRTTYSSSCTTAAYFLALEEYGYHGDEDVRNRQQGFEGAGGEEEVTPGQEGGEGAGHDAMHTAADTE